jgi:hypothetical protein
MLLNKASQRLKVKITIVAIYLKYSILKFQGKIISLCGMSNLKSLAANLLFDPKQSISIIIQIYITGTSN